MSPLPLADRTVTEVASALRDGVDDLARPDRGVPGANRARRGAG